MATVAPVVPLIVEMTGPDGSDGYFTHKGVAHYTAPFDMRLSSFGFTFRDGNGNLVNMPSGIQFAEDVSIPQRYLLALDGVLNGIIKMENVTLVDAGFDLLIYPGGTEMFDFSLQKGQKMWFYQVDAGASGFKATIRLQFNKL